MPDCRQLAATESTSETLLVGRSTVDATTELPAVLSVTVMLSPLGMALGAVKEITYACCCGAAGAAGLAVAAAGVTDTFVKAEPGVPMV